MECFLCLVQKQDSVDCISMNSTTWDELQVDSVIQKHLWATIIFEAKSQWLCLTCWRILQEFHKFYVRIETAQKINECIIKKELEPVSNIECSTLTSEDFVEPEVVPDQSSMCIVKEELEFNEGIYDENIPLIHIQKRVETSEEVPINENLRNKMITEYCDPNTSSFRKTNERDVICILKSEPESLRSTKGRSKSSLKYFYQSRTRCSDYNKFIREYFNLTCSNCEQSFFTFAELKCHFLEVHNKRGYVVCCEKKIHNRGLLVDHINCHLNPRYFKCQICPKVLKQRKTYKNHMRSHRKKPHNCDICNKRFQRKCYLDYHKQSHISTADNKIPCTDCDKIFATEQLLSNHMETVHLKKYEKHCDICGQSTPNLEVLTRHMQKHDAAEPAVNCDVCGLQLPNKNDWNIHMKTKHPTVGYPERVCHICQRVSLTENALRQHIRRNHRLGYIHKCTMCDKAFKRLDHYKLHLNVHKVAAQTSKDSGSSREYNGR